MHLLCDRFSASRTRISSTYAPHTPLVGTTDKKSSHKIKYKKIRENIVKTGEIVMRLLDSELNNKEQWKKAEIGLPQFDRQAMKEATKKTPQWVHFGGRKHFRAFPAAFTAKLLNEEIEKTGIIVAEGYDYEIVKRHTATG